MKRIYVFLLLTALTYLQFVKAQSAYYQFPVRPGKQNFLSGSMGEIRGNHFHAGIDIDTESKTGLPVYAAADGYISRIKISEDGYGYALYMKHPNGQSTVYGHLSRFDERIARFIRQKQYAARTFEIDISPAKGQFTYKKGQQIASSGNSGGSEGPHLHFEIRNAEGHALNPLRFGFPEIRDTLPPKPESVVLKTFSPDARIGGKFGRQSFYRFTRQGNEYRFADDKPVNANGWLGIEVKAYDESNGIDSKNGISRTILEVDGQQVYDFEVDKVVFSKGRYINLHIDYQAKAENRGRYQRCYVQERNYLNLYRTNASRGRFLIADQQLHQVKIHLYDSRGNATRIVFDLQHDPEAEIKEVFRGTDFTFFENYLLFNTSVHDKMPPGRAYLEGQAQELQPLDARAGQAWFRWDLRQGIPDSIVYPGFPGIFYRKNWNFQPVVFPDLDATRSIAGAQVTFPKGTLLDTLYLAMYRQGESYHIGELTTPLLKSCNIALKPPGQVSKAAKTKAYWKNEEGEWEYKGGNWKGESIEFSSRDLGEFALMTDTTAPHIRLEARNGKTVHFTVGDDLSGISSYRATVNGQWILAIYDPKEDHIRLEPLNEKMPLSGTLELTVKDRVGNVSVLRMDL